MKLKLKSIALGLTFILFAASCEIAPTPEPVGFTIEDENKLGDIIHNLIVEDESIYVLDPSEHEEIYNYISGIRAFILGTRMLTHQVGNSAAYYDWQIHVIYDETNQGEDIFTTVGGHIYINTGMLKYIQNENQLLNLLAHEMVYADNQAMRKIVEAEYTFSMILDVIRGGSSSIARAIKNTVLTSTYDQSVVESMDSLTVNLICPTPYSADGLAHFLTWLGNEPIKWHIRHPSLNLLQRAQNISTMKMDANCTGDFVRESTYQGFLALLP